MHTLQQFFVQSFIVFLVSFPILPVTPARIKAYVGELEGKSYKTRSGKEIYSFLGVPYATPPTGKHRFDEPKPVQSWIGVWFALNNGPPCMQTNPNSRIKTFGKEDCLYLNIYTPSISNSSTLPVLVFFHGGSFMFGRSARYLPDLLMENHDIVYISVSYRVGPFGFLSTEDDIVPGNNGLKDQSLALKWIQENIDAFGGDKSKVTISGGSAGGASVHYHFLSPLSRELFDKGISASGSALVPWALAEKPLEKAKMLANSLGCPTVENRMMVECLKQRPSEQILVNIESLFMPWMYNPFSPFGPVVENSSNPFLSSHPHDLLLRGATYDRPWLASVTSEEGLYPVAIFMNKEENLQELNKDWTKISPHLLDLNFTIRAEHMENVTSSIKTNYLSGEDISVTTQDRIVKMASDRLYHHGMDESARLQASSVQSKVFFYVFSYRGESSITDFFFSGSKKNAGVSHHDDMLYLIDSEWTFIKSSEDKAMQLQLTEMWASFIKTGRPSFASLSNWIPVQKDSKTTGKLDYLLIKSLNESKMVEDANFGNKYFWNSLNLYKD